MRKHSRSSGSSGRQSKMRKEEDSLCHQCTPIDRGDMYDSKSSTDDLQINTTCNSYFEDDDSTPIPITIPTIDEYLSSRNIILDLDTSHRDKLTPIDCLQINKKNIIINTEIVKSENIIISKYISNGAYGIIFITSPEEAQKINYVIKIIKYTKNNENEIEIMIDIKTKLRSNPIPNYIYIAYYNFKCNNIKSQGNKILSGINSCIGDSNYSLLVLEYFDNNINDLIQHFIYKDGLSIETDTFNTDLIDIFKSIFAQIFISLYIFHNKFNYYHNDAHLKNFFYKKVQPEESYFHYKINGNDYYIKNEGYLVVLADYGLTTIIDRTKNILNDYSRILSELRWLYLCAYKFKNELSGYISIEAKNKLKCYNSSITEFNEQEFIDFILTDFLKVKRTLNGGEKVINVIPYDA
jgi:hypothetical protein